MTSTQHITTDLIDEIEALAAEHAGHAFYVYADPEVPGLAWQARYGDDDDYELMTGPVGDEIDYDPEMGDDYDLPELATGRRMNRREANELAREMLAEVERAGYPVGR